MFILASLFSFPPVAVRLVAHPGVVPELTKSFGDLLDIYLFFLAHTLLVALMIRLPIYAWEDVKKLGVYLST